jgi:hypothetical protein
MSKRADEMRTARETFLFAQRNGCSMLEAKRRLANIRRAEAEDYLARVRDCGTAAHPAKPARSSNSDLLMNKEQPWMMRD